MGPRLYGEALRCMASPGTAFDNDLMGKNPQPDYMRNIYKDPNDNGSVHINSGIMNKSFYLVARELETENAALIWSALQNLWPTANFNDAVAQIVRATQLLIKNKKWIHAKSEGSIQRSWTSSERRGKYLGQPYRSVKTTIIFLYSLGFKSAGSYSYRDRNR